MQITGDPDRVSEAAGLGPRRRRSRHRRLPVWLTRRRAILAVLAMVALIGGTYGTRLIVALGNLTHENPITALLDLIRGKGGSDVQASINSLDPINIALYGYGGPPHDGPYLTDSIMVVSIQPRRDGPPQVAEVSVPRDWYVPIDLGGGRSTRSRINEAFQDGVDGTSSYPKGVESGPKVADATLGRVLGLHIDHHVGVDFTAFTSGVDAVGGVDVDVPDSFTDHQYPRGECVPGGDCSYMTVRFRAGMQHMDGARALIFTRSRHSADNGEGTDFARSRRQQLVLQALKSKVVSVGGLGHLPDLLNALSDHVSTDLKIGDAEALYDLIKGVDHRDIARISLDDGNFLYECGYPASCSAAYLLAHDASFHSVGYFLQHLHPDPGVLGEHAPVSLIDASGTGAGASARWSALLKSIGFSSTDGGPVRSRPSTRVIDDSGGHHDATGRWLADFFGVPLERAPAPASGAPSSPPADGGIRVILGQDEERVFNTSGSASSGGDDSGDATPAPRAHSRSMSPASSRSTAIPMPRSGSAAAVGCARNGC